jgi:ribonucleoside-diphosphate reductase subunit M2
MVHPEPILDENPGRFCMFPIKYDRVWEFYKQSVACFWTPEELDLAGDRKDWDSLTDSERHFLKMVLAFFAQADGVVNENLGARFMSDVQIPEARAFYSMQLAMESIHNETYSLLIDTYIQDADEKARLFSAVDNFPSIKLKADWALRWISSDMSFSHRLVAFACMEGIMFSGSFAAIFYMKKRGLLPGLSTANQFIARDEGMHADFACHIYSLLTEKLDEPDLHAIVTGAVDTEREFICESLPCSLIGMNAESMYQYIQFVADRLVRELGYKPIYNAANPFPFMEQVSLQGKQNFFEGRESSYAKANVMTGGKNAFVFDTECEF